MNSRVATILAQSDLGASGTKIIDINIKDVISRITINFYSLNAALGVAAHAAANIEKIEIVDGSDVLISLTGFQAQALNFYDRGKTPYTSMRNYDATSQRAIFGIDFGRYLYDPKLAFDPKKFTNPQIRITWDETNAQADTIVSNCTVMADIFDELVPDPVGFISTKEIYSYTVATTGYEYVDLPTDYIIMQLFAKGFKADYGFTSIFDGFKLSEDNDKRIPFDLSADEVERKAMEEYGWVKEHIKIEATAVQVNFYGMPCDSAYASTSCEGGLENAQAWSHGGGRYGFIGAAGTYRGRVTMIGLGPHGTFPLLPKPGKEIEDWYDVTKLGSLKLRIDDSAPAAATYTGELIIKQFRPYAG